MVLRIGPGDLARVIRKHRAVLSSSVAEDFFLSGIGCQIPSHSFLRNCTQSVYERQVEFLSVILKERHDGELGRIRVLDWGCGKGHITYLLKRRGFDVTSCDVDRPACDSTFGQDTPIIDQMQIQVIPLKHACNLPFDANVFDCVVSFGVLEHVPSDGDSLLEIRRILRPGGLLYVTFLPYFLSWTQAAGRLRGDHYHDRLYSRRSFTELVSAAGFEVCRLEFSQLFPKNSIPLSWDRLLEPIDRFLCGRTPLKYFATNLEAVLMAS
jgi:SAM-dependent methyltransferase